MDQLSPDADTRARGDILVVDDNDANLLAVEVALAEFSDRLVTVASGEAALRAILERDYAVVLLDVQMPGMDGFETARMIRSRERSKKTPIIFVTAFQRNDDDILEAYGLGAVDFLFKPIVPEVLRAKVGVFVSLDDQLRELRRRAELIRQHEQREAEQRMVEERRRWETESLARQVDEQRRAAEHLAVANARLEENDRRKNEFLAMLGHELRNPLAPIVNGVSVLQTRLSEDERMGRVLAAMARQSRHLTRLVDDLLEVSRVTSGKVELRREDLAIGPIVEQAIDMTQPLFDERSHEIEVAIDDPAAQVHGDAVRLVQVISNLLTNAARYTPAGGHVRVSARSRDDHVEIEVADDGPGVPPDLLPSVFDMFVQGRPGSGGLGIGLTLVQHLVTLHDGTVRVDDAPPGGGATFVVSLPVVTADGHGRASVTAPPSSERALRIAVVDDNEDIRETLRALLELWGHSVLCAPDGVAGLELLREHPVDVAFVDIGMPRLDGFGVAERLREQGAHESLFLIAMTGYGNPETQSRALDAGFDTCLIKPVDAKVLARTVEGIPRR